MALGSAGRKKPLSAGLVRDRYPTVSPDGTRIAVGSNRIGQQELWVVDVATRHWERVELPADRDRVD